MKRIAILGGGIAGVAAAFQLARKQANFTLFEASSRLGGIVETERREGFVVECGPDAWVTEKPWARELAIELGLEAEIIASNDHQRRTYLLQGKHLVPMPDGMRMMVPTRWAPIMESPLFSWQARLAYLREAKNADALKEAALKPGEDESVASFVGRHFGREVTETLAGPLLSGIFGGSVEKLSVRAVMPTFVRMEQEHGSLIVALQQSQKAQAASIFTTFKSGLQMLIDGMLTHVPAKQIQLEREVLSIVRSEDAWQVMTAAGTESFDAVIVATPAHVTRRLLRSVDLAFDALLDMEASSAIVVALAFEPEAAKRLRIPRGFGFLVPQIAKTRMPESDPSLLACTFVDQKFSHRVPEGGILLRAFFGGESAPALIERSDVELVSLVHRQLANILGPLPEPAITLVRRWPLSLPQYAVGHLDRMAELESCVAAIPNLRLIGNAYHGVGLPDLIRQGREAAKKIMKQ